MRDKVMFPPPRRWPGAALDAEQAQIIRELACSDKTLQIGQYQVRPLLDRTMASLGRCRKQALAPVFLAIERACLVGAIGVQQQALADVHGEFHGPVLEGRVEPQRGADCLTMQRQPFSRARRLQA